MNRNQDTTRQNTPVPGFQAWLPVMLCLFVAICIAACQGKKSNISETTKECPMPDTIRVATLYSPTSYFIYRDEPMGYDYSLLKQMAADKGMEVQLVVAPSLQKMIEMLDSGEVDLLAYEVPVTAEFRKRVLHCGPENFTHQVLVQPKKGKRRLITDVT